MDTSSTQESVEQLLEDARVALKSMFRYLPSDGWKSRLYLVTLLCQAPAVFARGFLAYCAVTIGSWRFDMLVSPGFAAWAVGLAPVIWSLSTFWFPGGGWWWHRYHGAREPSSIEEERILGAIKHLGSRAEDVGEYLRLYIYDSQKFLAYARGRTLLLSIGVLESKFLKPAVAHELGHFNLGDARVIQALDRLVIGNPFPPIEDKQPRDPSIGMVVTFRRWFLQIAGGQPLLNFPPLRAAWADYLRKTDLEADSFAADLGQDMALARYLKAYELQREQPNPRLLFNYREHVPVAQRIAALNRRSSSERKPRRTG